MRSRYAQNPTALKKTESPALFPEYYSKKTRQTTEISLNPEIRSFVFFQALWQKNGAPFQSRPSGSAPPGLAPSPPGKVQKRTARSPSPVVPYELKRSRATWAIIPATLLVPRSMMKRREAAEKPGGCWRRETANLSSPAPREISSNPTEGREEREREGEREREREVVLLRGHSSNFSAPPLTKAAPPGPWSGFQDPLHCQTGSCSFPSFTACCWQLKAHWSPWRLPVRH